MRISAIILTTGLLACNQPEPVEIPIGTLPTDDACGAESLQQLIGQDAGVLAAMTFDAATTRFFATGDALTMDFSATRLNVEFGPDGKIVRVFCG